MCDCTAESIAGSYQCAELVFKWPIVMQIDYFMLSKRVSGASDCAYRVFGVVTNGRSDFVKRFPAQGEAG